jgi:predicted nucleic acid-binding protein
MKAVSNSSVLIALSTIGLLSLLKSRFAEGVLIPEAVWREVVEAGADRPGAEEVRTAGWIRRCNVEDQDYVRLLCTELDEGEAEAIVLARQEQASVVLLDEKEARRTARRLRMHVLGTAGLLIWARRQGLIASLSTQLRILQEQGSFRLSPELCLEALRQVGEANN